MGLATRIVSFMVGAALGAVFFSGCANACAPRPGGAGLSILSYNVHNLFDATDAGTEYPEYSVEGGSWDVARYRSRLENLARVVVAAEPARRGPDLVCLEEVEGQAVLEDLRSGPLRASGYSASALVAAPGQAVNCGLLSRLPVTRVLAHALVAGKVAAMPDGPADQSGGPERPLGARSAGRFLLEVGLEAGRRSLTVFVCHWKSKLGGGEATEAERREDAALLASRAAELLERDPGAAVLACGDFNESPDEYDRVGRAYLTALMPARTGAVGGATSVAAGVVPAAQAGGGATRGAARDDTNAYDAPLFVADDPEEAGLRADGSVALYSPWSGAAGWSYLSKGKGERIDGFLLAPGLLGEWRPVSFEAVKEDFLLDSKGAPVAYDPRLGRGFSDHLPILLRLALPDS